MTQKEKYRDFCLQDLDLPVFYSAWWLDTVCGKNNWDVCLYEERGRILGILPYFLKQKLNFTLLPMPVFTPMLGPLLCGMAAQSEGVGYTSNEKKIYTELLQQLPKNHFFYHQFHPSVKNILPFIWKGFTDKSRFTYQIPFSELHPSTQFSRPAKRNLKKAREFNLSIEKNEDATLLYNIISQAFSRQKLRIPFQKKEVEHILIEAAKHQSSYSLKICTADGNAQAAGLGVFDKKCFYLIMGSSTSKGRALRAEYLLYAEMIDYAHKNGLIFDFEGSMIESIEHRNRSFGAQQIQYHTLTKSSNLYKGYLRVKELFKV